MKPPIETPTEHRPNTGLTPGGSSGGDQRSENEGDEMTEQPTNENAVMTASEVAALFRVHPKTVYEAFNRGDLPGVRVGRLIRFPRALVVEWARGNASVSRSPRRQKK